MQDQGRSTNKHCFTFSRLRILARCQIGVSEGETGMDARATFRYSIHTTLLQKL